LRVPFFEMMFEGNPFTQQHKICT